MFIMCIRKNGLNTFYIKRFRRYAKNKYRIIASGNNYSLQEWGLYNPTGNLEDMEFCWHTEQTYNDFQKACDECDVLRRKYILELVDSQRK